MNYDEFRKRIVEKVDLAQEMVRDGVRFVFDPTNAPEVQYHCPFHGKDNNPSSRFYRATSSLWCWKCHKWWDVVGYYSQKNGMTDIRAMYALAARDGIDIKDLYEHEKIAVVVPGFSLDTEDDTPLIKLKKIRTRLRMTMRGIAPVESYAAMVTAIMHTEFQLSKGVDVRSDIDKIEVKLNLMGEKYGQVV